MINLHLEVGEVNAILAALGELATKTGAWNLIIKIKNQADPQVPEQEKAEGGE